MTLEEFITKMQGQKKRSASIRQAQSEPLLSMITKATQYLPNDCILGQRLWHLVEKIDTVPLCICGKPRKFKHKMSLGYNATCTDLKCQDLTMKNTCIEKYGVNSVMKDSSIKEKYKKTNDEKHGGQWLAKPEIRKKRSAAILNRMKERLPGELIGRNGDNLIIKYPCGHTCDTHKQIPYNRTNLGLNPCVICFPTNQPLSVGEMEVSEFIESFGFDIIKRKRFSNPKSKFSWLEADIFIESKSLAIEYNGLYWHSEACKDFKYHKMKREVFKSHGIDLIYVWEDDWLTMKQKLKSRISAKLGTLGTTIGAMNNIKELDAELSSCKSGIKSRPAYIQRNYPEVHNMLNTNIPYNEALFIFCKGLTDSPKCICGLTPKFKSYNKGYAEFCSLKCANESGTLNTRHVFNKEEHAKKTLEGVRNKYGVDNISQLKTTKDKVSKTKQEKYGKSNYNNREKNIQTVKTKYGVDNVSKVQEIKDKRNKTFDEKYGGQPLSNNDIRAKIAKTNLEKYGVENPFASPLIIEDLKKKSLNKLRIRITDKYNVDVINVINPREIIIKCNVCLNDYDIDGFNLYQRVEKYKINPCTKCKPLQGWSSSAGELELLAFIKTINPNAEKRTIGRIEFDVCSDQLAFEYNGLYYHSSPNKDSKFHLNKTLAAESLGFKLMHIFEDEWISKNDLVKSMIRSKFNLYTDKIYARKCNIRKMSNSESKLFFESNHLQGSINSAVCYGLYYNDIPVFAMSFGKSRFEKNGPYEILRLASKMNTLVIGGANKLLSAFIKEFNPERIVSYCNYRISTGIIYEKLGFKLLDIKPTPNFFWVKGQHRYNRMAFQKHRLVKEGHPKDMTADEIMYSLGYMKIYDCGSLKFEWNK